MIETGLRDRKKLQTRAALTEAALRLVDERGLEQVTVGDISAAANVSARTFFNYFATKDEAVIGDHLADDNGLRERFLAADPALGVLDAMLAAAEPLFAEVEAGRETWMRRIRVMTRNPTLVAGLMSRSARHERDLIEAVAERTGVPPDSGYPILAAGVISATFRAALAAWAADPARTFAHHVQLAFGSVAAGLPEPEDDA